MRAIWKGAISFGLANIPIKLYAASEEQKLSMRYLHEKDLAPIRYAKVCRKDGKEIPYENIVRGYEYKKGDYVVLTEEDFERANPKKTKTVDIIDFTDEEEIDARYFKKPYYAEPDKGGEKAYVLLREALRKTGKVGIGKFVMRKKEQLVAVKAIDDVIVLETMHFADELRSPEELDQPDAEVGDKELEMALALVDQLSEEFQPEKYEDTYTEELKEVIEEKVEGKEPEETEEEAEDSESADLMAALKASLEGQQKSREKAAAN